MKWKEFVFVVAAAAVASIPIRVALAVAPVTANNVLRLGRTA